MNKTMLAILLMAYSTFSSSQSKRDAIWPIGDGNKFYPYSMELRFSDTSVSVVRVGWSHGTTHAACNDENGNLLFTYTFCAVVNKEDSIMENGANMNEGSYASTHDCAIYGQEAGDRSGALIFPFPNNPDLYYLMHIRNVQADTEPTALFDLLQLTTVDMSANNGLGKVVEKDQPVIADSLHDAIAAVRHGNGRDWWIIVPRGTGREFWELRLTPQGLTTPVLISIPKPWPPPSDPIFEYARESWGAQARFSLDGTRYVRYSRGNGAEVYDFDRCSGALTFRRMFPEPPSARPDLYPVLAGGICVSPNSRYLYFNNMEFLYQFDLCEKNLNDTDAKPFLLGKWPPDSTSNNGANTFFLMRNAPDGKIYMNSTNGCKSLHVIHKPDLPGMACQFVQASLRLPEFNNWNWPDFQNFNLYDLADSPCDSLGIDDPNPPTKLPDTDRITIYPNPANEGVNIFIPDCQHSSLKIYNISGVLVKEMPHLEGNTLIEIPTGDWVAGLYFFKLRTSMDGKTTLHKVVVVH